MVGAVVVGPQRGAGDGLHGGRRRRPAVRRAGSAPAAGTGSSRPAPRPDCPAGRAPAPRRAVPNSSGFPGRMAICQKSSFRPRVCRLSITRSWSPTEAPPVVTSMSMPCTASATAATASRVSAATGSTIGSPPAARTRAASAWELELTMPPGGIGSPGMAISSPVARMATRGRRCTVSQGWLAAAARPMSRAVRRRPAGTTASPAAKSWPARRMWRPAVTASFTRTSVPVAVGVLLQQDGVGALRHDAAGEQAHRLAGADSALERVAGRGAADHVQHARRGCRRRRAGRSRPSPRRRPAAGSGARSPVRR